MFAHHMHILAYLDPGTGSMVLQMLVGGVLGGALLIKLQWRRIVRFVSRKKPDSEPGEVQEDVSASDPGRQ